MTIGPNSFVIQDEEPITTRLDDEVVMMSVRAQSYFGLGAIGSQIWDMIAQRCRVADISAEVVRNYDVEPSICEKDVVAFLNDLLKHGLIRVVGEKEQAA